MDKETNKLEVESLEQEKLQELTDDEKIDFFAKKILSKYRRAFEELAK